MIDDDAEVQWGDFPPGDNPAASARDARLAAIVYATEVQNGANPILAFAQVLGMDRATVRARQSAGIRNLFNPVTRELDQSP